MHIQSILPICHRNGLIITDDGGQDADHMTVRDARFSLPAIVSAKDIVVPTYLQNPVQDILPTVPLIKRHIVFFQPARRLAANDKQILPLSEQGHHAIAHICIDQPPMLCDFGFKCAVSVIHPVPRCFSACQELPPHCVRSHLSEHRISRP